MPKQGKNHVECGTVVAYLPDRNLIRFVLLGIVSVKAERLFSCGLFHSVFSEIKGDILAKPNYQFEKRQKEIAKKNKKEEKRRQKAMDKSATDDGNPRDSLSSPEAIPES